jgi:hypothetical protein
MKILDRYASAIHSTSLKSEPRTIWSDTDVLGAAGYAAKRYPLGVALARMLSGGGTADVIESMSHYVYERGYKIKCRVTELQARDIAIAVLAWYRHGTCQPCQGTGYRIIPGTPSLGEECPACRGAGKFDLEKLFRPDWKQLAMWLSGEVERAQAQAGDEAMRMLADRMDLSL